MSAFIFKLLDKSYQISIKSDYSDRMLLLSKELNKKARQLQKNQGILEERQVLIYLSFMLIDELDLYVQGDKSPEEKRGEIRELRQRTLEMTEQIEDIKAGLKVDNFNLLDSSTEGSNQ
ncbi:MAG: cell division protein ZapA [Alphaproteobacteria bacterium]|nr:cell division protein ZapA [Alphaproteobacteria bacterium]